MFNKTLLALSLLILATTARAESFAYYKDFFDREEDISHDPDFPEYEYVNPKNDIYQMKKTGPNSGVGLAINLSLKDSGNYAFWLLKIDHRWKANSREIRFGKCQAFNGRWEYREGKLFLGEDVVLEAAYVDGLNMMKATFLKAKRPQGTEGIEVFLNDGSIDTLLGLQPNADDGYRCGGFSLPFWLPIPGERPW